MSLFPFFFSLFFSVQGQPVNYPQNDFQAPLDIPMYLAGNFGELRSNHFHAGLDIKTQGQEGAKIRASAEGYVSRIKIGLGGYGKALYIDHPNGYTTVYAHLQRFQGEIAEYVKAAQYQEESFTIELFPEPGQLTVKQGDLVALSGNTGGSGGPHLHFEIRETESEVPVNPLLFGFNIRDNIKPILRRLTVYPLDEQGKVANRTSYRHYDVHGENGKYHLAPDKAIPVQGTIGFGIEAIDKLNGTGNRNGVFSIELFCDGETVYSHKMEKIGFHETRYINSHIDYHISKKERRRVQRSFLDPNNLLGIYGDVPDRGRVDFTDGKVHEMRYVIKDAYGNTSELHFQVEAGSGTPELKKKAPEPVQANFEYDRANLFQTGDVQVKLEDGSLYEDIGFQFKKGKQAAGAVSPTYHIHKASTPLHKYMTLKLRVPGGLSKTEREKSLVVGVGADGKVRGANGGKRNGEFLTVKTKTFGRYAIAVDSIPPVIEPVNVTNGKDISSQKRLTFKISDRLAGITQYSGYVDGHWILMEYDRKTARLYHEVDPEKISPGQHSLVVRVSDSRGNTAEYQANIVR